MPRDEARKSYNHPCLIAKTLDAIGDRWTLLVLRDLMSGLHRYTEILLNCGGMSPNVLSDRLKRLQEDGLVERHHERGLPPQVEYTLTEKGWAVRPILLAMLDWGRQYVGSISREDVGTLVSTDFAVRMIPAFAFRPERAEGISASMVIEIADCAECNSWTFEIREGYLHPRRNAQAAADVYLKTNTDGFFQFIRGQEPPERCGELIGDIAQAAAIQACFLDG
jgi:DNA-binding HxlR family transcriptional regulator